MKFILLEKIMGLLNTKLAGTFIVLLLLGLILLFSARKTRFNAKLISYGALCMAASFILSYLKVFEFPNGGSITVASMLPMFLFAAIAGPWAGIILGICYGLLQFIQEPFFVHPIQFLLDYPLAFGMLGIAGFLKGNPRLGGLVGCAGRFICHFISGAVFFAEYANGQNVFLYSLIYNGSYLLPDLVICLLLLSIPRIKNMATDLSLIG